MKKTAPPKLLPVAKKNKIEYLPKYWSKVMAKRDQQWISEVLFHADGILALDSLSCWLYPPQPKVPIGKPKVDEYFFQKAFLWMPRRMFKIPVACTRCLRPLMSKGLYNRIREVIDTDCRYYLITEYLACSRCKDPSPTYVGWSLDILNQLDHGHKLLFPAVLTHKATCDRKVTTMLRGRTLGNSSTHLRNMLLELHSEQWMRQVIHYLSDCKRHKEKAAQGIPGVMGFDSTYDEPPQLPNMLGPRWFVTCHGNDTLARLEEVKAQITSVYGKILKLDSTKKVTN